MTRNNINRNEKITIVIHPLSGYIAGEVVIENKGLIER
jgi:hypothetical protein